MKNLLKKLEELKKSDIREVVNKRLREFESIKSNEVFSELCFCILTANSNAENCIRVQKEAGKHFETLKEKELAKKFKEAGCRFHTKRAGYISEARKHKKELLDRLRSSDEKPLREWVADNIKGLGMKEASHFLRNIGYKNVAIIDFHIIDILVDEKIIERPKKLDKKTYLEIEQVLENLGKKAGMNLAELDLYLWYLETGKVLK